MNTTEKAVAWAVSIANDNSHGYSQANRWGPDYDCSSLVISAWQQAGVPVRDAGASYTGNMKAAFLACGFADMSGAVNLTTGEGCVAGDVLLNERNHVAMSLGDGRMVWASTAGGHPEPGDQTGTEIRVGAFYSYPWDCCLRYMDNGERAAEGGGPYAGGGGKLEPDVLSDTTLYAVVCLLPELRRGDCGYYVRLMQDLLALHGCAPANSLTISGVWDGEFGSGTEIALNKFKVRIGLAEDGICDAQTFAALINKEGGTA